MAAGKGKVPTAGAAKAVDVSIASVVLSNSVRACGVCAVCDVWVWVWV